MSAAKSACVQRFGHPGLNCRLQPNSLIEQEVSFQKRVSLRLGDDTQTERRPGTIAGDKGIFGE